MTSEGEVWGFSAILQLFDFNLSQGCFLVDRLSFLLYLNPSM